MANLEAACAQPSASVPGDSAPGPAPEATAPDQCPEASVYDIVSFFSGCGGLDLGFVGGFDYMGENLPALPFRIVAAYDKERLCVATYNRNIGEHCEIADLSSHDLQAIPRADLLIGGFPCQDFSLCGTRKALDSDRGQLYKAFVRYMRVHRPMIVVAENVFGLMFLQDGGVLRTIKDDLEAAGYDFEVWPLYAPDFGVPQTRSRVFLVGVRRDLANRPRMPEKTHAHAHRSVDWALEDLVEVRDGTVSNQDQYFKAARAANGHGQGDENSVRGLPAYTIRANAKSRVQFHYSLPRRLTIRECARLQTFPDTFVFPHKATPNLRQIGNAVPPLLAHRVASRIAEYLRNRLEAPICPGNT